MSVNVMSYKIGRNDPCPCGSGKKYKKCCTATEISPVSNVVDVDFKWRQLRQLEGSVIDKHLFPYVKKELPKLIMQSALEDCFPEDLPEGLDRDVLCETFFLPWFLFNWISEDSFELRQFDERRTIAYNYVKAHGNRLSSQETLFIEAMHQSYYSFYSIIQVERDKCLLVKDILLGTTHTIKERQGTYQLERGDIIFNRIVTLDDQSISIGMAPFIIPAKYHNDLIDFRELLVEENDNTALTPDVLRGKFDWALLSYFFDIMKTICNRPFPTLMNTDGELLQLSKSYFKLTLTPEETLKCLLPLTLENDPDEFLTWAKKDKSGKIKQIECPWLKKGNRQNKDWDNTILGHITIENGRLILETNSQERTQSGLKLLSKYLGDAISFQQTLIETPEQKMKSLPEANPRLDQESQKLLELPEVQEHIKAMAKAHWENWFDEPVPLLKNQTPRQAAKTKDGRERLEALLLEYERHDSEDSDNLFKADVNYLRSQLSLDQ